MVRFIRFTRVPVIAILVRVDVRSWLRGTGLTVVAATGTAIAAGALVSMPVRDRPARVMYELFMFHNGPPAIVLLWLSWLVLRRRPDNGAGLVLLAIGWFSVLHVSVAAALDASLIAAGIDLATDTDAVLIPAGMPLGAATLVLLIATVWVPTAVLTLTMLPLLFPDGRLPNRRWRWVPALTAFGATTLMVAFAVDAWPTADWAEGDGPAVVGILVIVGGLAVLAATVASVVAMLLRWRRAEGAHRRPFRAVGFAFIAFAVVGTVTYPWQQVWIPAVLVAFTALLATYAFAVARYRLHDLEPVLGRAAVAAVLAVGVAVVYVAVVVGIGSWVGRTADSTMLPIVAVVIVALLIEPARRRVRRLMDRLLYRRHADRTEVLSRLAASASAVTPEEVLDDVVELLVRSTGAARAEVWLNIDPQPQLAASAGSSDEPEPALRADVAHHAERLGELRLYARAAADLVRDAPELLDDVAHSLGVVLRNARLTAQLRSRLDELRASWQRLVQVHDQARRGLERDIHDGAQSRLISLRLRLGVARALLDAGDTDAVREQLEQLGGEVDAAVRSLRELARGLHPPILDQAGVAAALRAHVRDLPLAVSVVEDGAGRYDRAVEGAVYFACLEAVQNAVRHGGARQIRVFLTADSAGLAFRVHDDGAGFDPGRDRTGTGLANIDDRVSALGGESRIASAPGQGTTISGQIPAQPLVEDR
ncbi:MAG: hypothetical protein GEU97_19510 [Actinophytocola sp.]|nr:hypothetical protein [Actinophytocola sp.]